MLSGYRTKMAAVLAAFVPLLHQDLSLLKKLLPHGIDQLLENLFVLCVVMVELCWWIWSSAAARVVQVVRRCGPGPRHGHLTKDPPGLAYHTNLYECTGITRKGRERETM